MKKFTILFLMALFIFTTVSYAQKTKNAPAEQVDNRIDNMGYWNKMAEKGLTPYNAQIPVKPAEYKGSLIESKGITIADSPDIPVTNLTNVTESENSVFIDPNNNQYILNSNNSTDWVGGSVIDLYGANYFQSSSGGISWGGGYQGAGGTNSGDPTTAIGLSGRQYVGYIAASYDMGVAYSPDGTSFTHVQVASGGYILDKNHMWIDNSPSSPYEGNLYNAWTNFQSGANDSEIEISRSTNDGLNWSSALNISSAINAGSHNQGVNIQTGPGGEVYVCWAIYDSWPSDETAIGFAKSTNGGVSYSTAARKITNIKGIRTTETSKNHRVNSFPVMAVDISGGDYDGYLYIVWTNVGVPGINTGSNISVYMSRSTDGGTSWSTPVRVNQGPNIAGKEAYFPWISCDPETGVLSVIFYDDRATSSASCETWVAYSLDAGNTWTDFRVSDVAFTPSPIPGLAGSYMGDYLGITSRGGMFYPCWTDTRNGLFMTYVSPFTLGLYAAFKASNTNVCTGTSITITDQSIGPPTSWSWSFPGGTPSSATGSGPHTITYNTPGVYNVSLTVSDGVETNTKIKTGYITVQNIFANFTGTPTTVVIGNTVTFTDNSTCNPTAWSWSFPGGTPATATGAGPHTITYSTLGTYNASLTVSSALGNDTEIKTAYINVVPLSYCTPTYTSGTGFGDYISLVQLGSINNATGASTSPYYTYYSSLSTNLIPNNAYTITLSPGTYGSGNYIAVWIDYNRNGVFETTEKLGTILIPPTPATGTINFTVPSNAVSGATRMRVREVYNTADFDPCATYAYGETEDYNVNIQSTDLLVDLTAFLEGPYNGSTMTQGLTGLVPLNQPYNTSPWNYTGTESVGAIPANAIDWVLIELRNATTAGGATSGTRIGRKAAFIRNDGRIIGLTGIPVLNFGPLTVTNSLFVIVHHRNHVSVLSATGVIQSGGTYTYNFTIGSGQAYGGTLAHKLIGSGVWGLFGGNSDGNGLVDSNDEDPVWESQAGTKGYLKSDFNFDTQSNNKDKDNIWAPNLGKGNQVPN